MPTPHRERQAAESFGVDAARYDRTRPSYPAALIERIVAGLPGRSVLDVGIGTGILARQLRAVGCDVLGVEPDPRMAAFARESGFDVEVARLEDWEPAGRLFDGVVSGQAWHWVDPVAGAAAAASALRPGGRLALLWNAGQPSSTVADGFLDVYERLLPGSPMASVRGMSAAQGYAGLRDRAEEGIRASGAFAGAERWSAEWSQVCTRDEWLDQLPTQGLLTRLPAPQLAELTAAIGGVIDAAGGSFPMHFTTLTTTAVRRAA
ncbi:class I SAM-dependent methyltransferase [Paractinoplanes brasiliensis]|uniref:Methyltransferase family protein n=1 Tax=Paractinoplanes brasiliensis TaxID=52695 RepID=A0A4R6JW13_9ACTN|nr:class I SAM-dependent methyltransferase [Actinoplanes brasiliensis]TDO40934.1 methyltransferase family protein [Actinoplanes brasiliensis]GID26001.1 methyltransferase type 11 [Actinoplanes brasiliensis]